MKPAQIDYGEIIRTAFNLAWRHKSLWLLGLFAAGGMGFSISNLPDLPKEKSQSLDGFFGGIDISHFIQDNLWILVVAGALLLLYIITFFLLNCICTPALIDAVNKLTRGGVYRLRDSFSVGVGFIWQYFALIIMDVVSSILLIIVFIVAIIILFAINVVIGILGLLAVIPLGFFCILMINNIFALAGRALVVRKISLGDAIEEGYNLFMANKVSNLIIYLLYIGLTIAISIGLIIILGIMAIPFLLLASISSVGLLISLAVGVPLFLALSLPISGFLGAVFETMFTIFYFRLVEPATISPASTGDVTG